MEVLLQGKTCVFMDDALMIKGSDNPVFYEQITQVIYEKRYNSYDIVFYNEKNKKRTMQISFDDKENEEAILNILQEKVRNLEPRKAKHPIWKAGGLWITLYVLLAFIVLLKFFAGRPFENVSVPIWFYPFFLLVNMVHLKRLPLGSWFVFCFAVQAVPFFCAFCPMPEAALSFMKRKNYKTCPRVMAFKASCAGMFVLSILKTDFFRVDG